MRKETLMRHLILLAGVLWLALVRVGVPAAQHGPPHNGGAQR
jgi:hypothetical protein